MWQQNLVELVVEAIKPSFSVLVYFMLLYILLRMYVCFCYVRFRLAGKNVFKMTYVVSDET